MTCSPNQSDFVRVDRYIPLNETMDMVAELTYFAHKQFNDETYQSCVNVQYPLISDTIFGFICGPWGSSYCTPRRWWEYLGSVANGYSPFQINYDIENATTSTDGHTYHNPVVTKCNEPHPSTNGAYPGCKCADCVEACSKEDEPDINTSEWEFEIMGADGFTVVAASLFSVLTLIFIAMQLRCVGDWIIQSISNFFEWWGAIASKYPKTVIAISSVIALSLCIGIVKLEVTTDPIELWASPLSRSRVEKDFFDREFRPFYRTTQVIIKSIENAAAGVTRFNYTGFQGDTKEFGPIFNKQFLWDVLSLQEQIKNLTFTYAGETMTLDNICNKPLQGDGCNIQNIWGYWQDNAAALNATKLINNVEFNYLDHFVDCSHNPTLPGASDMLKIPCMASWGGPVSPYYILGGFIPNRNTGFPKDPQYHESTAIVMTIIINNFDPKSTEEEDIIGLEKAMLWEEVFVAFMKDWEKNQMPQEYMEIAFNSERSVEDELNRETYGDLATIAVSYVLMFLYITLSLGQYQSHSVNGLMIESKITLGLFGVMIVLVSVAASVGVFGMIGVPATLIIFEIIPFLVLAVGVDNIFILVQTYQRSSRKKYETHSEHVGRIVGEVAPSMLLSSASESTCFFLGALSDMPAVRAFALYAGMALLIDFFMQITCFVSLISLDMERQENAKYDVFCCVQGKKGQKKDEGLSYKFFKLFYAPVLMKTWMRNIVMIVFIGFFCSSIAAVPKIEVGLDQEVSMPEDSFVLKYFLFLKDYLSVGPPVYFVVNNTNSVLDFSTLDAQNKLCMGQSRCESVTVGSLVNSWAKLPEESFIATSALNWVDTYINWVHDKGCCRYQKNSSNPRLPCPTEASKDDCISCAVPSDKDPSVTEFQETVEWFLSANPRESCPHGGHAAFADAVQIEQLPEETIQPRYKVIHSNMMAFHTILKTSKDYYTALQRARELADEMTVLINDREKLDESENLVNVFPYSIFYVFYEQYLTMWEDTIRSLLISLVAIFLVTFLLMGFDIVSSCIIIITIVFILTDLLAVMYYWHITLNAVSLVNLVMAVGISVEFCSHITRTFSVQPGMDRVKRAEAALVKMGSSALSGITLTKFSGIIVLYFAQSQIFTIFYFR